MILWWDERCDGLINFFETEIRLDIPRIDEFFRLGVQVESLSPKCSIPIWCPVEDDLLRLTELYNNLPQGVSGVLSCVNTLDRYRACPL